MYCGYWSVVAGGGTQLAADAFDLQVRKQTLGLTSCHACCIEPGTTARPTSILADNVNSGVITGAGAG